MLRTLLKRVEGDLILSSINNYINPMIHQTIRWKRKPRWLPMAKSKMFRVNERIKLPKDEEEELKRLFNNYRTEMKSIKAFFAEQIKGKTEPGIENLETIEEQDEQKSCFELNEQWNMEVNKLREATLAKEKEAELEEILKTIEENKIKMEQRQLEIEEIVRKEKERAKSYITAENVDEAIDKALENEIDYNFSIDLKGNYYYGRKTKPPKTTSFSEKEPSAIAATV